MEGKKVLDFVFLNPEDGTDSLSRKVDKKSLPNNQEECSSKLLRGKNLKSLLLPKKNVNIMFYGNKSLFSVVIERNTTNNVKECVEFLILMCGIHCYHHTLKGKASSQSVCHLCSSITRRR